MTETKQKLKIKLKGFDSRSVDSAAKEIVETAKRSGATVSGPVPLPTENFMVSLNRSPHGDKKSMDQFGLKTHKRYIEIIEPTTDTVDDLRKLNLPAGVEITINT